MINLPQEPEQLQLILSYGFGFFIILALCVLVLVLSLGHVEEKTSFGLTPVIETLKAVVLFWAGYTFRTTVTK